MLQRHGDTAPRTCQIGRDPRPDPRRIRARNIPHPGRPKGSRTERARSKSRCSSHREAGTYAFEDESQEERTVPNHSIATIRNAAAAAAVVVFYALPVFGQPAGGLPLAPELTGLGSLEFAVTTRVPAAQRFFNQGLRLLYAFNHAESRRAFREAARLDPGLAMARWGEAMTWGPNLNAPMSVENGRLAYRAIQDARASAHSASKRERGLIDALARRYAADGAGDRPALDAAYAAAMSHLATQFPEDPDVLTLYADAMMNTMPWNYWQKDGKAKPETVPVMAALESAIARDRDHAGAHHYYIHLLEASETPERAEASADGLGTLMPAA